jgi:uridine kinase
MGYHKPMPLNKIKIISVSGASGSGKSTLTHYLNNKIQGSLLLSLDRYYLSKAEQLEKNGYFNFDDPASIETDLLTKHLEMLKTDGETIVPIYDFTISERVGEEKVSAANTIIIDGLFAGAIIGDKSDYNIFVDVDIEKALERRITRDVAERGRTRESVLEQFASQVRPSYYKFVEPLRTTSDYVLKNNEDIETFLKDADNKLKFIH